MNRYEALMMFNPSFEQESLDALFNNVETVIKNNKGTVLRTDRIGRKKLAYKIQKNREAFVAVMVFEAPSQALAGINNSYRLNEDIMRVTIVRNDSIDVTKPAVVAPITGREAREPRGGRRPSGRPMGGRGGRRGEVAGADASSASAEKAEVGNE
ncbi:MAG: 30S ribosomal protein S6 [Vampirovibrionales bacterium]